MITMKKRGGSESNFMEMLKKRTGTVAPSKKSSGQRRQPNASSRSLSPQRQNPMATTPGIVNPIQGVSQRPMAMMPGISNPAQQQRFIQMQLLQNPLFGGMIGGIGQQNMQRNQMLQALLGRFGGMGRRM